MKIKSSNLLATSLILLATILSACEPQTPETQVPPSTITVVKITENDMITGQITQTKTYDLCESESSATALIQFSEFSSQTSQKALTLSESGGGQIEIEKIVELKLEGSVQEYFSVTKQESQGTLESITFTVPAHTHKEYSIIWKETRRTGSIEYLENGQRKFVNFSYRTRVEFESSSVRNIDCNGSTETPMPPSQTPYLSSTPVPPTDEPTATPTPGIIKENCIHSQLWKPASTDPAYLSKVSINSDGCYEMEALGIFTDNKGILHLNYRDQPEPVASGIYTPINSNSVIEFKIFVNSMYIVYLPPNPVTVSFAIAPEGDPLTARNTARFKLHVETNDNEPVIYFVLADVNENTGVRVNSQHYEYGRTYTIRLELVGNVMNVFINDLIMNESLLIPNGQKVFYIGFNIPRISGVDVEIRDLIIDGIPR